MDFKVYSPSYKRPGTVIAHHYMSELQYVICESQADDYRKHCPDKNLWVVPDSAQGNVCRVRNFILDNGGPDLVMVDDDLKRIAMWSDTTIKKFTEQEAYAFIENAFIMCEEGDFHYWGLNCTARDRGQYQGYCPFSFKRFVGGPFCGHHHNECRYDESLSLKEDYDMTLQVLKRYRWLLRFNFAFYENDFHGKAGGCAAYRTMEREHQQFEMLQRKWGKDIVKKDTGMGLRKKKGDPKIDPIIYPPIIGV